MPRYSPLDAQHRDAGAKMVDFGGWEMPLAYRDGTIAEHLSCRRSAAVFDVSHLGTIRLQGPDAFDRLQSTLTNDLRRIGPGRAQYTHLLDDDAFVVDDIIVWWLEGDVFDVMPNASNTANVVEALGGTDTTGERAVIAVQGPEARRVVSRVAPTAAAVARFGVTSFEWQDYDCWVAGTGYTGEDGVECAVPADAAAGFWSALIQAGGTAAGLGARDTLRLEAGLPLHGNELGPGITPLQAGLGWVVGWDKPEFRGRDALRREKEAGPSRRLRGIKLEGRQPPRHGQPVLIEGSAVGEVTSGNFSPVLEVGIGLAFLPPEVIKDTQVEIDSRGRRLRGHVVSLPFVTPGAAR